MKHLLHIERKPLLQLLILLLGFSFIFLSAAAPPRYLVAGTSFGAMVAQEQMNKGMHGFVHGRMEIETNDYSGSGANTRHDPKPPERS